MLSDSQGRLWLGHGTDSIVERKEGIFHTRHVDEAPWSNTLTFYEAAGTIWVGGSNGLSVLNGDGFKRVHSLQPNLLQGTSGIAQDQDGNLWVNAGAGVLRISTDEVALLLQHPEHMVKVDVFDENDGLVGQPTQFKRGPSAITDTQGTPRLASFERILFEFARPTHVVLTTPNSEYNAVFEALPAGQLRHSDHRFEWTRVQFEDWANNVAARFGYTVHFRPISEDPALGASTQMAIFSVASPTSKAA